MKFIADLHIHSHYSIATSKQLTPEYLDYWGRIKGIKVIGTGDFTHPGWIQELREKLEPADQGLFRLKDDFRIRTDLDIPAAEENEVRFMLTAEISNIYKKNERTRKVHNVVFAPDFTTVDKIQQSLRNHEFNITSDGRPILGLDSRDLLELCLNASEEIFFVPAHIWTPWFSALGSKSGFDTIEACYSDLSCHIHAVETGLSSDPPMNWLCSFLDRYTLISNSDAHSPEKLGREGNLFDTETAYDSITDALKNPNNTGFKGTLEFFPQEGKYHHDGHRKCGISWEPNETVRHQGICPVCGKQVTIGVMHRVVELADRKNPDEHRGKPFYSLIPLKEILSEIYGVGPGSKKIIRAYRDLIGKLGSEFDILLDLPLDDIRHAGSELLAEGIRRMRSREVILQPGYDGEYGVIRVFGDEIKHGFGSQKALFQDSTVKNQKLQPVSKPQAKSAVPGAIQEPETRQEISENLNSEQESAVRHKTGPALIIAGPGTGKTRVLTQRIEFLIQECRVNTQNILAVTFTNKAAGEMRERLQKNLSPDALSEINIRTFHALGYSILKTHANHFNRSSDFQIADADEKTDILKMLIEDASAVKAYAGEISEIKQGAKPLESVIQEDQTLYRAYEQFLREHNLFDLEDLICKTVQLFHEAPEILSHYRDLFQWILVDEYQDINHNQYRLIRLLMPAPGGNLFVIGDPNQAIYGFRGANREYIDKFKSDFPEAVIYPLHTSYRCSTPILQASTDIMKHTSDMTLEAVNEGVHVQIIKNATHKSEAEFIARTIESMMGGLRFFSMDSDITGGHEDVDRSLADFAVLCRISRQMPVIEKAFHDHSIPFQTIGDQTLYRGKVVRNALELLKWSCNPADTYRIQRVDRLGLPAETVLKSLQEKSSLKDKLSWIHQQISASFSEEDRKLWQQLISKSEPFGNDESRFLTMAALNTPADNYKPVIEHVTLMTLHAAKGLEFPVVFIAGCEDGLLPYHFGNRVSDLEEERRLLYVGMTRAKARLFLSYAEKRQLMGQNLTPKRSPFLDDIEKKWIRQQQTRTASKQKKPDHQMGLFE